MWNSETLKEQIYFININIILFGERATQTLDI